MTDETLEISREKLFDILSKAFTELTEEALVLMKTNDKDSFQKRIIVLIDGLNHDILNKSKREKPVEPEKAPSIEVDWS